MSYIESHYIGRIQRKESNHLEEFFMKYLYNDGEMAQQTLNNQHKHIKQKTAL